jgi:hypothetical protein
MLLAQCTVYCSLSILDVAPLWHAKMMLSIINRLFLNGESQVENHILRLWIRTLISFSKLLITNTLQQKWLSSFPTEWSHATIHGRSGSFAFSLISESGDNILRQCTKLEVLQNYDYLSKCGWSTLGIRFLMPHNHFQIRY